MPDSYLKKQYLFACFNITLFTKGSGVMWKTTTSVRVGTALLCRQVSGEIGPGHGGVGV